MKKTKRHLFFAVLLFCLAPAASGQQNAGWKISDYLENLPKAYKTYSGDFSTEPTDKTTLIDEKNGYAAFYSQEIGNENAFPVFEIALFKKAGGEQILMVSNRISDPVCTEYQTFFLEKSGENWLDVKARVLPELTPQMFFDAAKTAGEFIEAQKKLENSTDLNLHFSPPREGTTVKVGIEICDYVPEEFDGEIDFQKFIEKSKTVSLNWNRQKGVFVIK